MIRIAAAACRYKGQVFYLPPPARHWNVIQHILSECAVPETEWPICPPADQGFVTETGQFLGRREAYSIALRADQLLPEALKGVGEYDLFSEDLW